MIKKQEETTDVQAEQKKIVVAPAVSHKPSDTFMRLVKLSKNQLPRIGLGFAALIVNSITNLSFPWLMGRALDMMHGEKLVTFLASSALIVLSGSIASLVRIYNLGTATENIAGMLRMMLFQSYMDKEVEFFENTDTGELLTVLEQDVNEAAEIITEKLSKGLRSMNSSINGSILLFITSPKLCMVTLSVVPLVGIGAMTLSKYSRKYENQLRKLQSDVVSYSIERFNNISTVRLNDRVKYEKDKFNTFVENSQVLAEQRYRTQGGFFSFLNFATNFSVITVLFVGGYLIENGEMTAGSLTRFAIQSAFVGFGFSGLSTFYSDMLKGLDAAARIFSLLDRNLEEENEIKSVKARTQSIQNLLSTDSLDNNSHEKDLKLYKKLNIKTALPIEFNSINFAYLSRPDQLILNNFSLNIQAGKITCIIGRSGCGKSTIGALLCGLYRPNSGFIRIGSVITGGYNEEFNPLTMDSKELDEYYQLQQQFLRQNIGVVEQSGNQLLSTSIAENIEYGKDGASQDEIEEAAKIAGAHDFILSLPEGYKTQVGMGGSFLSGGQRARISLARALIKDPPCLLLDETTAALDLENEQYIINTLLSLRGKKTIVLLTHSEAIRDMADEVYNIDLILGK